MSTQDEKRVMASTARRLAARGRSVQEIMTELQVSAHTVCRWLDPAKAEQEQEKAQKARNARTGTRPCVTGCGREVAADSTTRKCQPCRLAGQAYRKEQERLQRDMAQLNVRIK